MRIKFANRLLARARADKAMRDEVEAILSQYPVAADLHHLRTEGALSAAVKAAAAKVQEDQEFSPMWIEPYRWAFKSRWNEYGPIATFRKAYAAGKKPRRKAQVELGPVAEQDVFDVVDEARGIAAAKFNELYFKAHDKW